MARTTMNLQDGFLNQVRKENTEIKMILLDGAELVGWVRGFDNFTVIVASQSTQHLVYKHAIAQVIIPRSAARPAEPHEQGENRDPRPSEPHRRHNRERPEATPRH